MDAAGLHLTTVIGSARAGRFGPTVADWFLARAVERTTMKLDTVDVADPEPTGSDRLHAADAFVVVTPEYNHSYPAALKEFIDRHRTEWFAKPVGFVSYGGISGGLRAVEHLRLVFAELHATTLRDTVSFHHAADAFDPTGVPRDPAATAAADLLLDRIGWWAAALHAARAHTPYEA